MKKNLVKRVFVLATAAVMALSVSACGASGNAAAKSSESIASASDDGSTEGATIVKYSVTFGASGTQADGANALAELIEKESEGRLQMQFYPSSQLGDKAATMEGLQNGTIEMTECAATDLSAYDDIWSVFSLPYLWENGEQAVAVVQDDAVKEVLEASAEANGFKIIAWTDIGSRSFLNKAKTVNTTDDLKGLKIRCMEDKVLADATNAMGAIGTPMAASDVYTGLQQGTLDGLDHTPSVIVSNAWEEICKYYSLTEHFTIPDPVFVSLSWFNTLSEEDQEAIVTAGEEFSDKWNNEIWPSATDEGLAAMEEAGVEITEVDKTSFIEACKPVTDEFLSSASDAQKELYDLLTETAKNY